MGTHATGAHLPHGVESFVIAIDGPAGTGKSTVARKVADELAAGYLDTGAMYRMVTLAVLQAGVDPADHPAVANLLPDLTFSTPLDTSRQRHELRGRDVTDEIRGTAVTLAVTPVSANPAVRGWLLDRQRTLAHSGRMVVEGRDIGTVIAPDAALKIYLTADATERARRRHQQNRRITTTPTVGEGGEGDRTGAELAAVALDLARRDTSDSGRAHAPLLAAADAVVIDSSELQVGQTVSVVLKLAAGRGIS